MVTWDVWKQINKDKITHPAGYEEKFVDLVLSKIPELSPNDVIPQHPFKDNKGGNRYIDFMIINSSKGWYLPIELDGKWKTETYHDFNDMLERQNALIAKFGILLRYSNKKMFNDSASIISEIRNTLSKLNNHASTNKITTENTQKFLNDLDNSAKVHLETTKAMQEMQKVLQGLQEQLNNKPSVLATRSENKNPKHIYYAAAVAIVGITGFGTVYFSNNKPAPIKQEAPEITPKAIVQDQPSSHPSTTIVETPTNKSKVKLVENSLETQEIQQPVNEELETKPETTTQPTYVVGTHQQVCGEVVQYKAFSKGVYLNLGHSYPNQDITIVIWNATSNDVFNLVHSNVCTSGVIKEYKGKPTVEVETIQAVGVQ